VAEITEPTKKTSSKKLELVLGVLIGLILVLGLGGYALEYGLSPASIREPKHIHFHFRMILLNSGKAVEFGQAAFQTDFNKDVCSAALTKQPIHFHDNLSQYGHIHWAGMSGGLILKNYGWNLIGGIPSTLGYRFDEGILPVRVPIHGNALPTRPAGAQYYIYSGTATSHTKRRSTDFLNQPLDTFLRSSPVIDANEGISTMQMDSKAVATNDVVGNVVIFVQKDAPTSAQITTEFNNFMPLPDSPCEG
jgi:hypothetical protein